MIPNTTSLHKTSKMSWWFDILSISLVALLLYTILLGSYPLFIPDEGRYSDVVREMIRTSNYITPLYNGIPFLDKPPLFYWIQTLFVRIFGLNEWGLRLWPTTVATLGCVATYITGRQLFNRRTGWFAAIVLGSSLFYFVMAHVADLDLTVAIFITLSLFSFLLALQNPSKNYGYFYVAYFFAGLAILTKGLIGIIIPMIVIGLWILTLRRWKTLLQIRLIGGAIIIMAICFPWFYSVQKQNPNFFYYFFYIQHFHRYITHEFNSRHGLWFYPFLLIVGTLPWTLYVLMAFIQKIKITWKSQHPEFLFLLLWVISTTIFFSIPISKTMGYILPVLPPLALMTASYLDAKIHFRKQWTHVFVPLIAVLMLYPIIMLVATQKATQWGLMTSKPLALSLKARLKPNDIVIFYDYFYQDFALYLDHDVLLAGNFKHEKLEDNWRQDFTEGLKDSRYPHHTLTPEQLRQCWQSNQSVYVVTLHHQINTFKKTVQSPCYPINHYQHLWLFHNKI